MLIRVFEIIRKSQIVSLIRFRARPPGKDLRNPGVHKHILIVLKIVRPSQKAISHLFCNTRMALLKSRNYERIVQMASPADNISVWLFLSLSLSLNHTPVFTTRFFHKGFIFHKGFCLFVGAYVLHCWFSEVLWTATACCIWLAILRRPWVKTCVACFHSWPLEFSLSTPGFL